MNIADNAAEVVSQTNVEELFDMSNPEHVEQLKRYYDAQAIVAVTTAGHEVENAEQAWAIIRGSNLMQRLGVGIQ